MTLNAAVGLPQSVNTPLANQGVYNTGLVDPTVPGPHDVAFKVGDTTGQLPYVCLLHVENGMVGTLNVSK